MPGAQGPGSQGTDQLQTKRCPQAAGPISDTCPLTPRSWSPSRPPNEDIIPTRCVSPPDPDLRQEEGMASLWVTPDLPARSKQ